MKNTQTQMSNPELKMRFCVFIDIRVQLVEEILLADQ